LGISLTNCYRHLKWYTYLNLRTGQFVILNININLPANMKLFQSLIRQGYEMKNRNSTHLWRAMSATCLSSTGYLNRDEGMWSPILYSPRHASAQCRTLIFPLGPSSILQSLFLVFRNHHITVNNLLLHPQYYKIYSVVVSVLRKKK
jgi:hypothetical protein